MESVEVEGTVHLKKINVAESKPSVGSEIADGPCTKKKTHRPTSENDVDDKQTIFFFFLSFPFFFFFFALGPDILEIVI